MTTKKVTVATLKPMLRNKWERGEEDYSGIPDPDRSRTGKTASSFTNNVFGLIIWKHMHDFAWF